MTFIAVFGIHRAICLSLIGILVLDQIHHVSGTGMMELWLRQYNNSAGTYVDEVPTSCSPCDPFFLICVDHYLGNDNPDSCLHEKLLTENYDHMDFVTFGSTISGGIANPILVPLGALQDYTKVKIDVWDDHVSDESYPHYWTDTFHMYLRSTHSPDWTDLTSYGIRPNDKTSMELSYKVSCDEDWYGDRCDVYCSTSLGNDRYYTCNTDTGDKECFPGWTDPDSNCTVDIDECSSNPCVYGICRNLEDKYRCICYQGTNGTHCENDLDECDSSPCLNGGTCSDQLDTYICVCPINFSGDNCEIEKPKQLHSMRNRKSDL